MLSDSEILMTDLMTYVQAINIMAQAAKSLSEAKLATSDVMTQLLALCEDLQHTRDDIKLEASNG